MFSLFHGPFTSLSRSLAMLGLAGLAYVTPASAQSQLKDVDTYSAVVTADLAPIHCGNGASFYRVGEVPKGSILTVDGEDGTWARVHYPATVNAWVKADEVSYDAATKTAKLTKASSLRALSTLGPRSSWQTLLPAAKQLSAGTSLKVISELNAADGSAKGFKVVAPDGARGYVQKSLLRRASADELTKSKPAAPASEPKPETKVDTKPETKPAGESLADPMTPVTDASKPATPAPQGNPGEPAVLDQHAGAPAGPGTDVQPKPADDGKPALPEPPKTTPVETKPVVRLDHIEEAFARIQKQGGSDAEIQALIDEINATKEQLASDPNEQPRVKQLEVRKAVLQTRLDQHAAVRKLQDVTSNAQSESSKVITNVELARRGGVYSFLGRLETSSIYDGKNLPQLFRVVSTGDNPGSTLGYLKPDATNDLAGKVGQIIGVIGEGVMDTTLKVKLIKPSRVDVVGVNWQPPAPKTDAKTDAKPAAKADTEHRMVPAIRPAGAPAVKPPAPAPAPAKESDDAADGETPQK